MMELIVALQLHFLAQPDVYVSGNILMFYEEGDRNAHVSPDVLIAKGVPQRKRENYKIWEEGKAPDLVIEVTSKSTKIRDVGFKKGLYEVLGPPRRRPAQTPRKTAHRAIHSPLQDSQGVLWALLPDVASLTPAYPNRWRVVLSDGSGAYLSRIPLPDPGCPWGIAEWGKAL